MTNYDHLNDIPLFVHNLQVGLGDSGVYIATFENSIAREETRSIVNVTQRISKIN